MLLIIIVVIVSCTGLSQCFLHLFSNYIQLVCVLFYTCSTLHLFNFFEKTCIMLHNVVFLVIII